MRLLTLEIHNYKSLREVVIHPRNLTVLVGANGAGKSNFIDAIDFIGEMYRWGLEMAVARHGGYENVCYRRTRRSKSPVKVRIVAQFDATDIPAWTIIGKKPSGQDPNVYLEHEVEFGTTDQRIESPFRIIREKVSIDMFEPKTGVVGRRLASLERDGRTIRVLESAGLFEWFPNFQQLADRVSRENVAKELLDTQSALAVPENYFFGLLAFSRSLGSIRVFQFSPGECRKTGVPIPNPELDRSGINLPAVIQHIKAHRPRQYQSLLATLKRVMPTLEELGVVITPQKTLSLTFSEAGYGRPWTSEDVSDGTIRAVALLAAIFDPTVHILAVEEPENSLHPWAIRQFVHACREAAEAKQIFLTTHSPVLIDQLAPKEVWIVRRNALGTSVDSLESLDPDAANGWSSGDYTLAQYLDSGAVPEVVPV